MESQKNEMEIGIIIDTVYSLLFICNKEEMLDKLETDVPSFNRRLEYLEELEKKWDDLHKKGLLPFFYCEGKSVSFISNFTTGGFLRDSDNFSFDEFIKSIEKMFSKEEGKSKLIEHLFDNISDKDLLKEIEEGNKTEAIIKALESKNWSNSMIVQTTSLFYNFDSTIKLLVETLKHMRRHIESLREEYKETVIAIQMVRAKHRLNDDDKLIANNPSQRFFVISLINPYVNLDIRRKYTEGSISIRGYDFETKIDSKPDVNILDIIADMDRNRLDILNAIKNSENKKLTMSQISDRIKISKSTASRHMNILRQEDLIKPCPEGSNIYYELNVRHINLIAEGIAKFLRV